MRRSAVGALLVGLVLTLVTTQARGEESDGTNWVYDEGLQFRHDSFQMNLGFRPQFRYTYSSPDTADNVQDFQVRRLKFFAAGWAYQPWIEYKVQFNAVGFQSVGSVEGLDTDMPVDGQSDTLNVESSRRFDL